VTLIQRHFSTSIQLSNPTKIQRLFNVDGQLKFNVVSTLMCLLGKVTTRSLYTECIANLKLPIDAFYRESRSGVNIAKRNITTGLFGLNQGLTLRL
jgi:hypothetical protein